MQGAVQPGAQGCRRFMSRYAALCGVAMVAILALPSAAQMRGPATTTTVGGHFLAPAPSVLSVAGPHLAPPLPSVTSIPNYGYRSFTPYYNGYYRRGYGYRYGSPGLSYSIPYYFPVDGYGFDYSGGPELYSGPPIAPADSVMHMMTQPPAHYANHDVDAAPPAQPAPVEESAARDARPNEPSVLIFRDGHKQEISNYAIMGSTVYVFDKRTQKIALADLDVPATIKANDDRGLEFNIPKQKPAQKKSDLELKLPPDESSKKPANIASLLP